MNGPFKIGEIRPIQYFLAIGVIIGLLFSMVSDGDDSISAILPQIIQWQLQVLIPLFILIFVHTQLHKITRFDNLNPWLKLVLSGFIGALLFSPLALFLDSVYGDSIKLKYSSALLHEFTSVAPPVILSWIAINAPWLLGFQLTRSEKNYEVESGDSPTFTQQGPNPEFYNLLPENIQGELIYLKAELHYLKVVTVNGSALILFNLKDAILQLNKIQGFKTHRSFWVAKSHIKNFSKTGRQGKLQTSNDEEIPVSRNRLKLIQNEISNH